MNFTKNRSALRNCIWLALMPAPTKTSKAFMSRVVLPLILISAIPAFSQSFRMNLEQDPSGWTACVYPLCNPGGQGTPTSVVVRKTGATEWPSSTLELSVTGPAGSNMLVFKKVGATNASNFMSDVWVFLDDSAFAGAYEYDIFAFNAPYEFMWGSQCRVGKEWDIWDQLHGTWIPTSAPCTLTQDKWHHVQWWVHRVPNDTSCGGMPCLYYDRLGVDNVYTSFVNGKQPAGWIPGGWGNDSGFQFQMDIDDAPIYQANMTEFLQQANLVESGN